MIAAQAKQGNISGLQAKGLFDAVKSIADQQVQLDAINRMLQQLGQGQKGLNAATQAAARNMASQVGGLAMRLKSSNDGLRQPLENTSTESIYL